MCIFYGHLFTFFFSLNFESLLVFCKFCVADALLHFLSCGYSLVSPCAISSVPHLQILQKCFYKGQ